MDGKTGALVTLSLEIGEGQSNGGQVKENECDADNQTALMPSRLWLLAFEGNHSSCHVDLLF